MTVTNDAKNLAELVAEAAEEKLGEDIKSFDVSDILGICEVFVLVTARNNRQVGAVMDNIVDRCREDLARNPTSTEGLDDKHWVLVDYGDVVVHIFLPEEREKYRLERLFDDAPAL